MRENQNVEYKQSWRDEYLKWVCGFANAGGGVLKIGKDDRGEPVGLGDVQRLLEELPNKIRDTLGIIIEVDLVPENNLPVIQITVDPHPYPVSYHGRYFFRSGSTNQELRGAALDQFLLRKQGRHWDEMPLLGLSEEQCDPMAFETFRRKAQSGGRLGSAASEDERGILHGLRLRHGDQLKRAAALLFHFDPEQFFPGAFIKIGYFFTDDDLRYQDAIRGNLFDQIDGAIDLLTTKYLVARVDYRGLQRVERYSLPIEALREALLNALVHKDYAAGVPIQISVYDDRLILWNGGSLPEDWNVRQLLRKHPSVPRNPLLANAFFLTGHIEAWGRGIEKMFRACREYGVPEPVISADANGVQVTLRTSIKLALSRHQVQVLRKCLSEKKLLNLMSTLGRSDRTKFRKQVLNPLIEEGLVEMSRPDKPTSSKQTYRITPLGEAMLRREERGE